MIEISRIEVEVAKNASLFMLSSIFTHTRAHTYTLNERRREKLLNYIHKLTFANDF